MQGHDLSALLPSRLLLGPPLPSGHQGSYVSREAAQGPQLILGLSAPNGCSLSSPSSPFVFSKERKGLASLTGKAFGSPSALWSLHTGSSVQLSVTARAPLLDVPSPRVQHTPADGPFQVQPCQSPCAPAGGQLCRLATPHQRLNTASHRTTSEGPQRRVLCGNGKGKLKQEQEINF